MSASLRGWAAGGGRAAPCLVPRPPRDAARANERCARAAGVEAAAVLISVAPPPQTKHFWMTLQAGGQEQSSGMCHRAREPGKAAMQFTSRGSGDPEVVLFTLLSQLCAWSSGAAPWPPWLHAPLCPGVLAVEPQ